MKRGYVPIWRKTKDWVCYKKSQYIHLWIHLLISVNVKEKKIMWNGETIIIKEGQILTGRKQLSLDTGISESTIERILKFLENEHQLEQQKTTKFRIITIVKWQDYKITNNKTNNKRTTDGQQMDNKRTQLKNDNKDKNEKNEVASEQSSQIQKIMEVFSNINPTLNWGNKTDRGACLDLIKQFGFPNTKTMAERAVEVQGRAYAPRITKPYQLKSKLADLKIYFDSEKSKQPKIVKIRE